MKNKTTLSLLTLFIVCIIIVPAKSFAQAGILITKTSDTIYYTKIENNFPDSKYWVEGSNETIKIPLDNISNQIPLPEYKLEMDEVDEFTGSLKRVTNIIIAGGSKRDSEGYSTNLVVFMAKIISSDKTTMYLIKMRTPEQLGCSGSDKNFAMIKFKDNEVIELKKDISDIDCNKNAVSIFVLTDEIINKLRLVEIKSIRLRQSEAYEDFNIIFPQCLIKSLEILDN